MVLDLRAQIVHHVAELAHCIKGNVVAVDDGALESLRWSGSLSILLKDFEVPSILSISDLESCQSREELVQLIAPCKSSSHFVMERAENGKNDARDTLVLLISDYLWDYRNLMEKLVNWDVIQILVCSTLSEETHICCTKYGRECSAINFNKLTEEILSSNSKQFDPAANSCVKSTASNTAELNDEWEWGEEKEKIIKQSERPLHIVHTPLHYSPILSNNSKTISPSLFVLSNAQCASAFSLLLSHIQKNPANLYKHVREVPPQSIPFEARSAWKHVAYTLKDIFHNMNLQVQDRIFAIGSTSVKIGHTLLQNLSTKSANKTSIPIEASLILMDRIMDLATPCSFDETLLDALLRKIPQTPSCSTTTSNISVPLRKPNLVEVYPLAGADPQPTEIAHSDHLYKISSFVSDLDWKGGATLCHPSSDHACTVLRALAFMSPKLALRELDRRLQIVERQLQLPPCKMFKNKKEVRGRDVVLRRLGNILRADRSARSKYSALIEIGMLVLETLERLDLDASIWSECRDRTKRHDQLRQKHATEWILPEIIDWVQRQLTASPQRTQSLKLSYILSLLIHAFALSSDVVLEDHTLQMLRTMLVNLTLYTEPDAISSCFPDLYQQLQTTPTTKVSKQRSASKEDDWDWEDGTFDDANGEDDNNNEAASVSAVSLYVEKLVEIFKVAEIAQVHADSADFVSTLSNSMTNSLPTHSLVAQLVAWMYDPTNHSFRGIEHIVDASEQLTRAGIDLLRSGFSRFGFTSSPDASKCSLSSSAQHQLQSGRVIVIFVVGGITLKEVMEIQRIIELKQNCKDWEIVIGSTTITNGEILLRQIFGKNWSGTRA
ncbi:unnamed protein product [Albugo candida]|uniref:Sec1 family domain-containing protein 2 n=1 Tax=Albugo candida TaxID=65357 RepID=A0A024GKD9_9STRA|nr:unnamed protein product [Albugo candida]|eukprot:CCI47238.1 unnamed protein product [Albugo candida]